MVKQNFFVLLVILSTLLILSVPALADPSTLFLAISNNRVEEVRDILVMDSSLASSKSGGKMTPLHVAAAKGHLEIVIILMEYGVDVNSRTLYGSTPTSFAVVNNHTEVARVLRERGGVE